MNVAVIGTGNVGSALSRHMAGTGYDVILGSRNPQGEKAQALVKSIGKQACAVSQAEAAASAEVVVLATPWGPTKEVLAQLLPHLNGKVLIDCTNPLTRDLRLDVGFTASGGEMVAEWSPGSRVVKAFNSVGAGVMASTAFPGGRPGLFICGDDASAKTVAGGIGRDLGFDVVDAGPLVVARFLEPLTMLWLQLSYVQGMGPDIAFALLRR